MSELVSWLTNHAHFAQALERWRENVSGAVPDKHVQVKIGINSISCGVEFFLIVHEDLRGGEDISDVATFSARPSLLVDTLRGLKQKE